ncbi:MAG TPA: endonuclease III, partial [Gemmatimonadales bacterium]
MAKRAKPKSKAKASAKRKAARKPPAFPSAEQRIGPILAALKARYPDARCSLNYTNPLELLAATILSAQCTDARVNIVTKTLFARYQTAQDYADADPAELAEIIKSTGFFNNKTKSLIGMGKALAERHGGVVPRT